MLWVENELPGALTPAFTLAIAALLVSPGGLCRPWQGQEPARPPLSPAVPCPHLALQQPAPGRARGTGRAQPGGFPCVRPSASPEQGPQPGARRAPGAPAETPVLAGPGGASCGAAAAAGSWRGAVAVCSQRGLAGPQRFPSAALPGPAGLASAGQSLSARMEAPSALLPGRAASPGAPFPELGPPGQGCLSEGGCSCAGLGFSGQLSVLLGLGSSFLCGCVCGSCSMPPADPPN